MCHIGVVVLNYNKKELLERCLLSLFDLEYENFDIIVVDNGSSDGSIDLVRKKFEKVFLVEVGYNSGFCKGNNLGIKKAFSLGCDAVVILNNDTVVDSFFLRGVMLSFNNSEKIGMISTNIRLLDSPQIIDANGFLITPDGLGKNLNAGKAKEFGDFQQEVFCPTGAATFYSKELLEDIKQDGEYFDEDFEFCYEELDLGWRARLKGWKCLFAPKAIVYHKKSGTGGAYSDFFAYYSSRNITFNIIKNYPSFFYVARAFLLAFLRDVFLFLGIFFGKGVGKKVKDKNGGGKLVKIFLSSHIDAMKKIRRMFEKRSYIQKNKKVTRLEVKRWFKELGIPFFDSIYKI